MGRTTPRALDGVVDGVVKQSEEQSEDPSSTSDNTDGDVNVKGSSKASTAQDKTAEEGDKGKEEKQENGMQTFFTKVSRAQVEG